MTTSSGLAAVAAATDSVSRAMAEAAIAEARAAGRAEGLTEGEAKGRTAGASEAAAAERARLLGIEAHAIPGHEKLIAECKADPAVTPDMAAGRILAAEKKLRADQMAGIQSVEGETGKVGADAASQRRDTTTPAAPQAGVKKSAEAYEADWAKSEQLQADFATAKAYANYAAGVADGRIRVLKAPVAAA